MKRFPIVVFAAAIASVPLLARQTPPAPQAQTPAAAPGPQTAQPGQAPSGRPQLPPLGPNEWRIDASHSAATFSVRHNVVSTVRGQLGRITGKLEYDGKNLETITVDVAIDVAAIDTQNDNRDKDLRSASFFDVENHPALTFKSRHAETVAPGRFKLIGDLTIKGNTKEVVLDVEGPAPYVKSPRGVLTGATATTKINRHEFGITWNRMIESLPVVGDEVSVTIDLELIRPALPAAAQS